MWASEDVSDAGVFLLDPGVLAGAFLLDPGVLAGVFLLDAGVLLDEDAGVFLLDAGVLLDEEEAPAGGVAGGGPSGPSPSSSLAVAL